MTFIVAEVGSNWLNLTDALDSIGLAKNCGADAVKFQLFSPLELYGQGQPTPPLDYGIQPPYLPKEWLADLKAEADFHKIEFMCSAFSPEGVDLVDPYVKRHKVASAELGHLPLLERVRAKNKPVLLSTGGSSLSDIGLALNVLGQETTPMYCVANYPAKDINLWAINKLREQFSRDCGYSCHSTELATPVAAVFNHRAVAIEKHFKLRDMPTPDNAHSLNPEQFIKMTKMIRGNPMDFVHFPDPQEKDMVLKHNRRLLAFCAIPAGETLVYGQNFGVYRSMNEDLKALSGFAYDRISGKSATKDLKPGEPIGPGDFR